MHKWAKEILECVKTKVEAIGVDNFEGQNLDDLKDWTEIAKNIACFDKDYRIVEAMDKAEDEEEIMDMIERYEDYPERRYYNHYHYKNEKFAPKGSGTRRGYDEPMYHMPLEMYRDRTPEELRDMDRHTRGVMYFSEPLEGGEKVGEHKENMHESKYDKAKRMYTETKEMHKGNTTEDKQITLKEGEKFLNVFFDELDEMLQDATPEMRSMVKTKGMARMQKIQ